MSSRENTTQVTGSDAPRRPTAIVSWAHGDVAWEETVLEFARKLRVAGGVDADLDLWHLTDHEDWTTFGPTAIRSSDFVFVAISAAYRNAWNGTNAPGEHAGAMVEAAAIKAIREIDHTAFRRRVMVILLPGSDVTDIPADLLTMAERFEVNPFGEQDLESLLRSIYGRPLHERPALGPLPPLPPRFVAEVSATPAVGLRVRKPGARGTDDIDLLERQLTQITEDIASMSPEAGAGDLVGHGLSREELQRRRAAIQRSYDLLKRIASRGVARQRMVAYYLNAQLYLSAGAHHAAEECLAAVRVRLPSADATPAADLALEPCLERLTELATQFNVKMRDERHRADPRSRHPEPPTADLIETQHREQMRTFYEVARCAMNKPNPRGGLRVIRAAILHGREPAEAHASRLYARYTERQRIATKPLGLLAPTPQGLESAGADGLVDSGLDQKDGALASVVISALAEAHLLVHLVENHRSGPVGHILNPAARDLERDARYLRRSIMLNTWVLAVGESMPWIFSADDAERSQIQRDAERARLTLDPVAPMWLARQVTLLSLYRRSHGFRLLGDHERAYNDLRIVQRVGRLTRSVREDDQEVTGWLDTLKALAEYRIGELYRADHDYMQALVQLCRSHDSVETLRKAPHPSIAAELGHLEVKLSLGKGKAFFEIGAMKRSLKWYLTAWRSMLDLQEPTPDREPVQARIGEMESYLDRVKHDLVLDKRETERILIPVIEKVCGCTVEERHYALAADILVRISHLLVMLRLPEDDPDAPGGRDSSALSCMKRAATLDDRNLLVHTELLRYGIRTGLAAEPTLHRTLDCWPSGASDVDQLIRAGEHLTLNLLWRAGDHTDGEIGVARQLVDHFMTHTDSINLRGAILRRYVMRRRAEDREPWWEPAASKGRASRSVIATGESKHYLEFVCLRRYGSFTPFMPRPAAVSAVGGGYLVRICRTTSDAGEGFAPEDGTTKERLDVFNIVVDPGEGTVNNLYGAGLSIADIDMVIATHDHPDHLSALDSIISLRKERGKAQPADAATRDADDRLLILGNRSVVNRYSFLNGDGKHLVQHLADAAVLGDKAIPANVTIDALATKHEDLGGDQAAAFVLSFSADASDPCEPGASKAGNAPLTITFMADTAIDALYSDDDSGELDRKWLAAMKSDIVVAHVSDVPSHELRDMAELSEEDPGGEIEDFVRKVAILAGERPEDASQLEHALPLSPTQANGAPWPWARSPENKAEDGEQLYLSGLLAVCGHMREAPARPAGGAQVLIVGELKEQLGSFRRAIARAINEQIFKDEASPLVALTADIGLRIRVAAPEGDATDRNTVLCSSCSYNNDRLDLERFHAPKCIYEVCVKGDHEAIYWNCDLHDPGKPERHLFVEQMGGYNPFSAGGRYHG